LISLPESFNLVKVEAQCTNETKSYHWWTIRISSQKCSVSWISQSMKISDQPREQCKPDCTQKAKWELHSYLPFTILSLEDSNHLEWCFTVNKQRILYQQHCYLICVHSTSSSESLLLLAEEFGKSACTTYLTTCNITKSYL
jgi:type VI protein secretion system component VasA